MFLNLSISYREIKFQNGSQCKFKWNDDLKIGSIVLKNRICMPALTRKRCNPIDGVPNDLVI